MSVILQNYWLSILIIAYAFLAVLESIVVCMWHKGEGETHELWINGVLHSCGCQESTHLVHSVNSNWIFMPH